MGIFEGYRGNMGTTLGTKHRNHKRFYVLMRGCVVSFGVISKSFFVLGVQKHAPILNIRFDDFVFEWVCTYFGSGFCILLLCHPWTTTNIQVLTTSLGLLGVGLHCQEKLLGATLGL